MVSSLPSDTARFRPVRRVRQLLIGQAAVATSGRWLLPGAVRCGNAVHDSSASASRGSFLGGMLVAALAARCWSAVSCPTSDLSQLRRARPSLDSDSLATLIYADVNSRMDYCNSVLAGAPRTVTDKSQRVLNAAARVITGTRKFDRSLVQILHDQLRWLDVPDRVLFSSS